MSAERPDGKPKYSATALVWLSTYTSAPKDAFARVDVDIIVVACTFLLLMCLQ